jgi:ribulose-phosphate 3-epimerase
MRRKRRESLISLSILEYERELSERIGDLEGSEAFSQIVQLVDSGMLYSLHIDVMRPPLIPHRSSFQLELIRDLYFLLHNRTVIEIHLMMNEPELLIREINKFIKPNHRAEVALIIQLEAYSSEEEVTKRLEIIKDLGYKAGIGLNLPTAFDSLADDIISNADIVLIMSVPMGKGGQRFDVEASTRIKSVSERFPDKLIKVDGGINDETARSVIDAGARILVVGSYITRNKEPISVLMRLKGVLSQG